MKPHQDASSNLAEYESATTTIWNQKTCSGCTKDTTTKTPPHFLGVFEGWERAGGAQNWGAETWHQMTANLGLELLSKGQARPNTSCGSKWSFSRRPFTLSLRPRLHPPSPLPDFPISSFSFTFFFVHQLYFKLLHLHYSDTWCSPSSQQAHLVKTPHVHLSRLQRRAYILSLTVDNVFLVHHFLSGSC